MASVERIIWYDFNGFLHVEIFVEEPFFPAKKLLDERALAGNAGWMDDLINIFGDRQPMLNQFQHSPFSVFCICSLLWVRA